MRCYGSATKLPMLLAMHTMASTADDNTATSQTASKSLNCPKTMARADLYWSTGVSPSLRGPLQHIGVIKV